MNRSLPSPTTLELSGDGLTLDDAERILRGHVERLTPAPAARKRVEKSRRCLETSMATGATIYGVNTGFGKLVQPAHRRRRGAGPAGEPAAQPRRRHGAAAEPRRQPAGAGAAHPGAGQGLLRRHARIDRRAHRDVQPRRRAGHPRAGQRRRQRRPGAAGPPGPGRRWARDTPSSKPGHAEPRDARRQAAQRPGRPAPRPPEAVPAAGQGGAVAHQRHADQHGPPGRRPGPRPPPGQDRRRRRGHDRRGDEEFAAAVRPAHPGDPAASRARSPAPPTCAACWPTARSWRRTPTATRCRTPTACAACRRSTAPCATPWLTSRASSSAR